MDDPGGRGELEDGADVYYGQERVGIGGRPFFVWKFRSMVQEDVPGFEARCQLQPGLTSIAQILAPRDAPRQKFRYDRLYLRRRGPALDLRLVLLSFWIPFRGQWETRGRKF